MWLTDLSSVAGSLQAPDVVCDVLVRVSRSGVSVRTLLRNADGLLPLNDGTEMVRVGFDVPSAIAREHGKAPNTRRRASDDLRNIAVVVTERSSAP